MCPEVSTDNPSDGDHPSQEPTSVALSRFLADPRVGTACLLVAVLAGLAAIADAFPERFTFPTFLFAVSALTLTGAAGSAWLHVRSYQGHPARRMRTWLTAVVATVLLVLSVAGMGTAAALAFDFDLSNGNNDEVAGKRAGGSGMPLVGRTPEADGNNEVDDDTPDPSTPATQPTSPTTTPRPSTEHPSTIPKSDTPVQPAASCGETAAFQRVSRTVDKSTVLDLDSAGIGVTTTRGGGGDDFLWRESEDGWQLATGGGNDCYSGGPSIEKAPSEEQPSINDCSPLVGSGKLTKSVDYSGPEKPTWYCLRSSKGRVFALQFTPYGNEHKYDVTAIDLGRA